MAGNSIIPALPGARDACDYAVSLDGSAGYLSEFWFAPALVSGADISTTSITNNTIRATPFVCPYDLIIDKMSFEVTTNRSTSNVRVAIYEGASEPFLFYPDRLIYDFGNLATTSNGVKTATLTGVQLTLIGGKTYWVAVNGGGNASAVVLAGTNSGSTGNANWLHNDVASLSVNIHTHYTVSFTLGAYPQTFPRGGALSALGTPVVGFRIKSPLLRTFEGALTP